MSPANFWFPSGFPQYPAGGPVVASVTIDWNLAAIAWMTGGAMVEAHAEAAKVAAELAAAQVNAKSGTGNLEKDLRDVKEVGPAHSIIGSSLPYALKEQNGGTIYSEGKLLAVHAPLRVGGQLGNSRSTPNWSWFSAGGQGLNREVVALCESVPHPAKNYFAGVADLYVATCLAAYARNVAGGRVG